MRAHDPPSRIAHFDVLLAVTVALLAVATAALVFLPIPPLRIVSPAVDLVLDTASLLITALVAALAWVRFQERREPFGVFLAAAFSVLAIANFVAVLVTLTSSLEPGEPGERQLYIFMFARLIAAILLVVGGLRTLRQHPIRHPRLAIGLPGLAILAVIALVYLLPSLPQLTHTDSLQVQPVMAPFGVAIHLVIAGLFGLAALLARQLWVRDGAIGDKYVSFGLILAAFAQLQATTLPATHPGPVSSGDILRLAFGIVLLLAIEAEARSAMGSLVTANNELERMRRAEVERAALDERARLSRELHDGFAQDLWLAKLKIVRLVSSAALDDESRQLADEAAQAVEMGLSEARQAVMAMHTSGTADASFVTLLERFLRDYSERFAIAVELDADDPLPQLRSRTQAELLRIAQEALTNVHRHAHATQVSVRIEAFEDKVSVTIVDDGEGFDQATVGQSTFGLAAMKERAALIGGWLSIRSVVGGGTKVAVTAPVAP